MVGDERRDYKSAVSERKRLFAWPFCNAVSMHQGGFIGLNHCSHHTKGTADYQATSTYSVDLSSDCFSPRFGPHARDAVSNRVVMRVDQAYRGEVWFA